jgi:hypothetical protein
VETEASITSAGISSMVDVDCVRIAHFNAQILPENAPASRLYRLPKVRAQKSDNKVKCTAGSGLL